MDVDFCSDIYVNSQECIFIYINISVKLTSVFSSSPFRFSLKRHQLFSLLTYIPLIQRVSSSNFWFPSIMSGVNKENPVVEETPTTPTAASTDKVEESTAASTTPTKVDPATPLDEVKDAATSSATTVSEKVARIFGAFT